MAKMVFDIASAPKKRGGYRPGAGRKAIPRGKCRSLFCDHLAAKGMCGYCQPCYNYFVKNKGIQYPLPPKGQVVRTEEGLLICHICGKAVKSEKVHAYQFHGIESHDYCLMFGLNFRVNTTTEESRQFKSWQTKSNGTMKNLLLGEETRIKKGQKLREGHPNREQNLIRIRSYKKKG